MALQGKLFQCSKILGNVFANTFRYNFPSFQQIAGLRKSIEEKYNIPPKPKRPLTPYFKFMMHIRPEIKKEKPDAKLTDIVRETAARWEKVDPQYKKNLEAEYKREQESYAKERLEYDTKLTDEQKNVLKQARIDNIERKERSKLRKKCRENNKPKKPCTAFVLYMKSRLPSRGTTDFRLFQKQLSSDWSKLSDPEKKPFFDEMYKQMKEYKKQMVEWERKMIKMGNTDIVRQDALIDPKPSKPRTSRAPRPKKLE